MVIKPSKSCNIPDLDLSTWLFGDPDKPLSDEPILFSAEEPERLNLSKQQFRSYAKRFAKGLIKAGLKPQDKVLLFSGNNVFFPVVFMGIVMAEGVFTGANPTYIARELAYQLKDSGAKFCLTATASLNTTLEAVDSINMSRRNVFVYDDDFSDNSLRADLIKKAKIGGHFKDLLDDNDSFKWKALRSRKDVNTTAVINYSSGTTGLPKGVELSHKNFVANAEQMLAVHDPRTDPYKHIWLAALPMYHAYGQCFFVLQGPLLGISIYIMRQFDFTEYLKAIEKYKITSIIGVPPIMVALAKHPLATESVLSSVRAAGSGAAPLSKDIALAVEKKTDPAFEVNVKSGYGMTETTCSVLGHTKMEKDYTGSVGKLNPNCEAKIMDDDGVTELSRNHSGELWVRGPNIMKGYYKNPKATSETLTKDGWLKTGDMCYVSDKDYFYIVDRKKELIKVKGLQVAPAELEHCLLEHPEIADAGVIGIPFADDERPRAYLVKVPGSQITSEDVMAHMKKMVSNHKQLTGGIVWIDAVPKNPSGKILRKLLRERAKTEVVDTGNRASKL